MNINKPLSHEIKHNDINFIEKNSQKEQINSKNDNKKEEIVNEDLEETNEEIIENYPYEFIEEMDNENNDIDKFDNQIKNENNDNIKVEQNDEKYITSDYEPQPEPDQKILDISNLNLNEIKEKNIKKNNNEDVIDFDEENMIITNDNPEREIINININENENKDKDKLNKNQINDKDKDKNNIDLNIEIIKDKEINKEEKYYKRITSDKKNENINIRLLNGNNNENYSNIGNVINYSLDHDEIMDILNLNKENNIIENKSSEIVNDDLQKIFINKMNTKKLLEDLYEKEKKFKNAYEEYYSKLSETMNNNYFKNFFESSNISKDFIKQQNDINIFYSNNNNNYINFINKNDQIVGMNNLKKNKSESNIFFNKNKRQNDAYEEYKNEKKIKMLIENNKNSNGYMRHPTIILSIRKFLNEYNNSMQNRAFSEASKNPSLNYKIFIDILKDLYYIEQNRLSKLIFEDSSLYKNLWDFLVTTKSENVNFNKEEITIESNVLLLFILILNGYFSNKKIIEELEIELNWLKFEDYEMLIINNEYIEDNFCNLIEIRKNNYLKKSKLDGKNNKNECANDSKGPEDILSEYFNSYTNNANSNTNFNTISNSINTIKKKKFVYSSNNIDDKNDNKEKQINSISKQLYAFKPRNSSNIKKESSKDIKNPSSNKTYSLNSLNVVDKTKSQGSNSINAKNNNSNNNNVLRNTLNKNLSKSKSKSKSRSKSKSKSKIKYNHIKYNDYNSLSKKTNDTKEIQADTNMQNINNNTIKNPSNNNITNNLIVNGKSGNYITKVKQNRTDLKKLFKNNEYKDGTLNERLEQIKRQRNKSKSKGSKVQINYEEYNNNLDNNKEKNEQIQKPKYQFRKHTPQKKNVIRYNFTIDDKEYILEHNVEENIEIEILQLIQKNNLTGITTKSILEKIKINQKNNSDEIK